MGEHLIETSEQGDEVVTPRFIVGIGASAGGLAPLENLLPSMPTNLGVAFVIVQHLSKDYDNPMVSLLERHTSMPVSEIVNEETVLPNRIYLIPRGKILMLSNGRFLLTEKSPSPVSLPIDILLRSVAREYREDAAGIILSGTGSDGTQGARAIHDGGGLVLVQDEASAKFNEMPRNASVGLGPEAALSPTEMGDAIRDWCDKALKAEDLLAKAEEVAQPTKALQEIFSLLEDRFGIDFSLYRQTTILRRLQRHMHGNGADDFRQYHTTLVENEDELEVLYHDLLIGVTAFFRDPELFQELQETVIPQLVQDASHQLRLWVAGCASGEEAYSYAILLLEEFRKRGLTPNFKIFATDVHASSVRHAATGRYPAVSLEGMPPNLISRYFTERGEFYEVTEYLRRHIVFTAHNLVTAVPFTRLDLVSCRNLLIYLNTETQQKILALFRFSLRAGGYLVLGPSETLGDLKVDFRVLNQLWRIFQRPIEDHLLKSMRFGSSRPFTLHEHRSTRPPASSRSGSGGESELLRAYDRLLNTFLPPGFLVDQQLQLLHTFPGGEQYLTLRAGRSSASLLEIIHPGLRTSAMSACQIALRENRIAEYHGLRYRSADDGDNPPVTLKAMPFIDDNLHLRVALLTVISSDEVRQTTETATADGESLDLTENLQIELRMTQENLQATIEELEASNEALQATNEELVASNEELQSSNEELHSVNEELDTVNVEYQQKIRELIQLTDDTNNLLHATEIGVIFLDQDLCLRKLTPRISRDFRILATDIGELFHEIKSALNYDEIERDLRTVQATRQRHEVEIRPDKSRTFLLRISPYQTTLDDDGLVLSVVEITSVREAQERVEDLSSLVESSNDAIISFAPTGKISSWNKGAQELYGFKEAEAVGHNALELIVPSTEAANFISHLEGILEDRSSPARNVPRLTADGRTIIVSQRLSTATLSAKGPLQVSSIERDITRELTLRSDRDRLANVLEATSDIVTIIEPDTEKLIFLNRSGLALRGAEETEVRHLSLESLHPEHCLATVRDGIQEAVKRGSWQGETLLSRKNSAPLPVSQVILAQRDPDGSRLLVSAIMRDLSKEREAIEIGNTLSAVVRNFPEMLVVLDNNLEINFSSPSARAFIEAYREGQMLPLNLGPLVRDAMKQDRPYQPLDFKGVRNLTLPDGTQRYYLPRINILHTGRLVTGAVLLIQDVTEFRMLDDLKTSLIGTVSHELKNPVSGVTMSLGLALDGTLGPLNHVQRTSLEAAMQECQRITGTIKGLLDLTRFEESGREEEKMPKPPALLAQRSLKNQKTLAQQVSVDLVSDFRGEMKPIQCDAERVVVVLDNLISNALKHSPRDGKVTVTVFQDEENTHFLVEDEGSGIPEDHHDQVFARFFRVPGNRKSGSGLGLHIAKQFVEAHNGRIDFKNRPETGCLFRFFLPNAN